MEKFWVVVWGKTVVMGVRHHSLEEAKEGALEFVKENGGMAYVFGLEAAVEVLPVEVRWFDVAWIQKMAAAEPAPKPAR